jgi:protein involved in polysaccharide export with SLBB domain
MNMHPSLSSSSACCARFLRAATFGMACSAAALFAALPAHAKPDDSASASPTAGTQSNDSDILLRDGDTIKVSFPGAPDLNPDAPLEIRPDGKVTLPIVGEVMAAGRTPAELQKDLINLYAGQLQSKEVVVTVVSSTFSVFVDGAVMR